MRNLVFLLWLLLPLAPVAAPAQTEEADRGFLTGFLEDNLSSAGREVTITGFAGALSSRATIAEMTFADGEGIWLTLRDLSLDWSRSALLRGRLSVTELTAGEIIVARRPVTEGEDLPSPEATEFSLPELPVSIEIGRLAAERLELGAGVIGSPLTASLEAKVVLDGGEGGVTLTANRTDDGAEGSLALNASYSNETRQLVLDLDVTEDEGGIAATLLDLPGAPAVDLTIAGSGPIENYAADIRLATGGTDRLAGQVTLQGNATSGRSFTAELGGDVAPLFLPEYAEFFGPDVRLAVTGERAADGRLDLSQLAVQTRALTLDGQLVLASDGLPERIDLTGRIALEDGSPVLLPLGSGPETRLTSADLVVSYDSQQDAGWKADVRVVGLDRPDFAADRFTLDGSGRINRREGKAVVGGTLNYGAEGLSPANADLATALGPQLEGSATFFWSEGGDGLRLPRLTLEGEDYGLTAGLRLEGLDSGLTVYGRGDLRFAELARFSGLAGRPLAGSGTASLTGSYALLGGGIDAEGTVAGNDLAIGQAELDGLLRGASEVDFSVLRDTNGTTLRALEIRASTLLAQASGTVASGGSDLSATLAFRDLSVLGDSYAGSLEGQARFSGTPEAGQVSFEAKGNGLAIGQPQADALLRGESTLRLTGSLDEGALELRELAVNAANLRLTADGRLATEGSDVSAELAFPDLSVLGAGYRGALEATARFAGTPQNATITAEATGNRLAIGSQQADALLAGQSALSLAVRLEDGALKVDRARLNNPQLTVDATGSMAGAVRQLALQARLANLALVVPQFPGALTLNGTAEESGGSYRLNLQAQGPGGINLRTTGTLASNLSTANLAIAGSAQAALANAFIAPRTVTGPLNLDLRLNGPLALSSLSGTVSTSGARIADPALAIALSDVAATANLSGGRAQISASAAGTEGGRLEVSGGIGLTPPLESDLTIRAQRMVLKDPELFTTTASGPITLSGPLSGGATIAGRIELEETELRIPSTGFGGASGLDNLQHVNEPAPVRATRARARLIDTGASRGGGAARRPFGLNLTISSPDRIFIRGRGLDAELGGELLISGTTANVVPSGAFNLIRGRLDILGKRLVLSEALLQLQGDFVPYVRVVASNESDGIISSVVIQGQVDEPEVSFSSVPELPQEEVLSRLLFGRGLASISALQAAQLASAVATLAGRGGQGIVGNLREGFGLDDLDIVTDAEGDASLRAGKYLSENVYTEIEVGQQGQSQINLNLDVTRNVTVRGSAGGDGGTSLGVFIEKDY